MSKVTLELSGTDCRLLDAAFSELTGAPPFDFPGGHPATPDGAAFLELSKTVGWRAAARQYLGQVQQRLRAAATEAFDEVIAPAPVVTPSPASESPSESPSELTTG